MFNLWNLLAEEHNHIIADITYHLLSQLVSVLFLKLASNLFFNALILEGAKTLYHQKKWTQHFINFSEQLEFIS